MTERGRQVILDFGVTVGSQGLDTTRPILTAKLLNILYSNTFGRISRVTESTFIRTRSDGRMVITCRIFKRPHHGFTTTHDRGASQFNRAPIFPWLKTFCVLLLRCKRLKLGLKFLYLPNFGLTKNSASTMDRKIA